MFPALTLSKPVKYFANFTFNLPVPSDTTPILLSDNAPVAPPLTTRVSPNFLLIVAPVSPLKLSPFSRVLLIVLISFLLVVISPVFFVISRALLPIRLELSEMLCAFRLIKYWLELTFSLTRFNWSSVAARPDTGVGLFKSQFLFVRPVICPLEPSTVTGCDAFRPTTIVLFNPTVYSLPPYALVPSNILMFGSCSFTVVNLGIRLATSCNWL